MRLLQLQARLLFRRLLGIRDMRNATLEYRIQQHKARG